MQLPISDYIIILSFFYNYCCICAK